MKKFLFVIPFVLSSNCFGMGDEISEQRFNAYCVLERNLFRVHDAYRDGVGSSKMLELKGNVRKKLNDYKSKGIISMDELYSMYVYMRISDDDLNVSNTGWCRNFNDYVKSEILAGVY